jgi:H(+)-translocating pyrophosphatase
MSAYIASLAVAVIAPVLASTAALDPAASNIPPTSRTSKETAALVLIVGSVFIGLVYSIFEYISLRRISISNESLPIDDAATEEGVGIAKAEGSGAARSLEVMLQVSSAIAEGASAFLFEEFKYLVVYIVAFTLGIGFGLSWSTAVAFVAGALTSCLCAFVGMKTAVMANVRTAHACWKESLGAGFSVAIRGGGVMGILLTSLGLGVLVALIPVLEHMNTKDGSTEDSLKKLFESIAGYGLGGSSIALFARVGGGIYTKAADVGADLAGKNEYGLDEDDPRNPATIADLTGDNVGDCAGMGADLFGSLAESTCASFILIQSSVGTRITDPFNLVFMYPVLISASGILVSLITLVMMRLAYKVDTFGKIEWSLKLHLIISTVLQVGAVIGVTLGFYEGPFEVKAYGTKTVPVTSWYAILAVCSGLIAGLLIGLFTEFFTSHSYWPVREIADAQRSNASIGIIHGLALGWLSTAGPGILIAAVVVLSHNYCGVYGLSLAALGMLSTLGVGLAIDAYGPISDNAGGIVEMAGLGSEIRARTDALDAAGNTTAAIGKGFAIGSAALVSLALFSAYCTQAKVEQVDLLHMKTFAGVLLGGVMAMLFSAMTMKSVGVAAQQMVEEVMRQLPEIVAGRAQPDYSRCVAISTRASVREMILPGLMVLVSPVLIGFTLGKHAAAGLLIGGLVVGVLLAVSMSNTGGAWDNAKKYIEAGGLGEGIGKGSVAHKNAVIGDTVGDPLKDTSGPSLNILIKLSAIVAVVIADKLKDYD